MATHTPGPFVRRKILGHGFYICTPNDDGIVVAELDCGDDQADYANSMLFSASPDLLKACEKAVAAHAHIETCDMPTWLKELEAAILKARGTTRGVATCSACGRPGHGADDTECKARGTT